MMKTPGDLSPSEDTPAPGKKPRRPKLSPKERDTRAALILQAKLGSKRIQEIQEEFRLSRASVYRALQHADKLGLHQKAQDFLSLNLVPLALAAYEEALILGDLPLKVDVANRILDGLGITGKHATLRVEGGPAEETFESFRAEVIRRVVTPSAASGAQESRLRGDHPSGPLALTPGPAVDGEVLGPDGLPVPGGQPPD